MSQTKFPTININQTIRENSGKVIGAIVNLPDPNKERLDEARAILIDRVRRQWIEVSEATRSRQAALQAIETDHNRFTDDVGLFVLPKRYAPHVVTAPSQAANVFAHLTENQDDAASVIPPNQSIAALFTDAQHALLILGEPGVGKTVTLLQLARSALQTAEADPEPPVPVILNLATWANQRLSIEEWIVRELNSIQYGIPKDVTQHWLQNHDLLLLLDGLNELNDADRAACVDMLNTFRQEHGTTQIVICCRREDYRNLPQKLAMTEAITIEPLGLGQLTHYFEAAGSHLAGLRAAIEADPELQTLATVPLMLTILSIAYADMDTVDVNLASSEGTGDVEYGASAESSTEEEGLPVALVPLLERYVARLFRYGGEAHKPYNDDDTAAWLAWLARQMKAHNQPTFLIEYLQPSWLSTSGSQWLYMLGSRLSMGLLAGLIGGIVIGMALAPSSGYARALLRGLTEGPLATMVGALVVGAIDMLWYTQAQQWGWLHKRTHEWQSLIKIALTGPVVGLAVALTFALFLGSTGFLGNNYGDWFAEGIQVGSVVGLSASLLFAFGPQAVRYHLYEDIQTVERVGWSRARAWRGGVVAGPVGLVAGIFARFTATGTPFIDPIVNLKLGLALELLITAVMCAFFTGLIGTIFGGFSGTFRKVEKITPNQGLQLSLVNAGWVAIIVSGIFMLMAGVAGLLLGQGNFGTTLSYLCYGLFIGVLAALWYGGLFVLQHTILRLLLWWHGHTPPVGQYARLLDYAAQRVFLYRVGGGYRFANSYLQDYFATQRIVD